MSHVPTSNLGRTAVGNSSPAGNALVRIGFALGFSLVSSLPASVASASDNKTDDYFGLGYGAKSFSAFPDADAMSSIAVICIVQPNAKAADDDLISGFGMRMNFGLINEGEVFDDGGLDALFLDALGGYEVGIAKKFSLFIGAGIGLYQWDPGGGYATDMVVPLLWDVNGTVHFGKRVLLTVGLRGDEHDDPDIGYPGSGSIDLSGRTLYAALGFAF